ncbi:hypothetical protein CYY_010155 [Polysphondylium violaceum]|uniref:Uncharacterized protein n=1 Tax=Polysphondylium violaceum TaxID=133409 RepID=A0A8J4UVC7_9MYCE|nr:hypothetical protein CYY_010155 [Polysphondylium violaceum]
MSSAVPPTILNHPDHMPSILKGLQVLGTGTDEVKKLREFHASDKLAKKAAGDFTTYASSTPVQIVPVSAPIFMTTSAIKSAYVNGNFSYIKQLEATASADLNPVYDNIKRNGDAAWRKVSQDGQDYWMSWGPSGFVWTYTDPTSTKQVQATASGDPPKVLQYVQFGTYSQNAQICGIHTYNLTLPTMIVESVLALIISKCLSSFIAEGLDFLVSAFASELGAAALEVGLELTFVCPEFVLPLVATCIVFAIAFIGISYFWDWINRKYTIRLQIFNYDPNYEWRIFRQYMDNGVIPGHDNGLLDFNLPKTIPANSVQTPPGFGGITSLDSACYYGEVIWNNDNTIFEGVGFAFTAMRTQPYGVPGFQFGFLCPRFADNKLAINDGTMDSKTYYNNVKDNNKWVSNPMHGQITSVDSTVVNYSLDALSGASDNLYNILINIKPYNSSL